MLASGCAAARGDQLLVPLVASEGVVTAEVEAGERKGRPVLRGYLVNDSPYPLIRVQLLVEALDQTGNVLAQEVSWLGGDLAASDRVYFEVPVPRQAPRYRVRPFAYERRRH